jgi:hypothetical protein
MSSYSKDPSFLATLKRNSIPSFSSEYDMDHILNGYIPNSKNTIISFENFQISFLVNDQQLNVDGIYTFEYPDRRRRRRR